jgi:hypothetical protein
VSVVARNSGDSHETSQQDWFATAAIESTDLLTDCSTAATLAGYAGDNPSPLQQHLAMLCVWRNSSSLPKHVDASGSWVQAICVRKPFGHKSVWGAVAPQNCSIFSFEHSQFWSKSNAEVFPVRSCAVIARKKHDLSDDFFI